MSGRGDITQIKENVETEEMALEPLTGTAGPNSSLTRMAWKFNAFMSLSMIES